MEPERITFPTQYPIKVIARTREGLRDHLDEVFERHLGAFEAHQVSERPSAREAFTALTYLLVVEAESQLGPLHADLQAVEGVIMVL